MSKLSLFLPFSKKIKFLTLFVTLLIFTISFGSALFVNSAPDLPEYKKSELAIMYAPNLQFATGESFFPTDINYHLENSMLKQKIGDTDIIISTTPKLIDLSIYSNENYYLDNSLGGFEEIKTDYQNMKDIFGYYTYVRVIEDEGMIVIQYWFFYAFNEGPLNQHEGDWETVMVVLDELEVPQYTYYSQHFGGERARWSDVEKVETTHPKVYVALGSHANYYRPFQGKMGVENDLVDDKGRIMSYIELEPIILGELGDLPISQGWLDFGGRWGDYAEDGDIQRGLAGPAGPGHDENEEKWFFPVSWGQGIFFVDGTWFTLSWIVYNFLLIFLVIFALIVVFKIFRIYKRKKQGKLNIKNIIKSKDSIAIIIGTIGIILTLVAIALPWYKIIGNIQTEMIQTQGEVDLLSLDGLNGLLVNTLQEGQGLSSLFSFQIPFSIILLTMVIFWILDLIGIEKASDLKGRYLRRGIYTLIIPIIIIIAVIMIASSLPSLANTFGQSELPPEFQTITSSISSSPIGGQYSGSLGPYDAIYISWGLGIGIYLFIFSAIMLIISSLLIKKS